MVRNAFMLRVELENYNTLIQSSLSNTVYIKVGPYFRSVLGQYQERCQLRLQLTPHRKQLASRAVGRMVLIRAAPSSISPMEHFQLQQWWLITSLAIFLKVSNIC